MKEWRRRQDDDKNESNGKKKLCLNPLRPELIYAQKKRKGVFITLVVSFKKKTLFFYYIMIR